MYIIYILDDCYIYTRTYNTPTVRLSPLTPFEFLFGFAPIDFKNQ